MTLAPPETACLEFPGALSGASEQVTCKSLGDISALSSHAIVLIPQSLSSLVLLKALHNVASTNTIRLLITLNYLSQDNPIAVQVFRHMARSYCVAESCRSTMTYGSVTTQATAPCRSAEGMSMLFQNQSQSWSRSKLTFAMKSLFTPISAESSP